MYTVTIDCAAFTEGDSISEADLDDLFSPEDKLRYVLMLLSHSYIGKNAYIGVRGDAVYLPEKSGNYRELCGVTLQYREEIHA